MTPRRVVQQPLGPRHLRALALIANGHTDASIGRQMGVSTHTASWYVKCILARLGAHDRAHAVALGIRHGYLRLDDIQPHPQLPDHQPAA
ncbi:response regulator transcription factor [Kitasatospora griseola]|uniref:response regulator transcription factor n=1 Tax=Kitasatospora griseola TaxID=2064 RepID=UPI00382E38B9